MLALVRQLHEEDPLDALRLGPVVGAAAGAILKRVRRTDLSSICVSFALLERGACSTDRVLHAAVGLLVDGPGHHLPHLL